MDPTELDRIADLLRRWQNVDSPMERVPIVSDAADTLRGLSNLDARTLAQGLWEHGAGPLAQQVADRAGTPAAPEELTEVAAAMLSLDPEEVQRFAAELRDPEERRRLLIDSGIPVEDATAHVAGTPPDGQQRIDAPPPVPPPPPIDDPTHDDVEVAEVHDREPDEPEDQPQRQADLGEPAAQVRQGEPERRAAATRPSFAPRSMAGTVVAEADRTGWLAERLASANNGRERMQLVEADDAVLQGAQIRRVLVAVPDGWQRRTVLRKLVSADRLRGLIDAAGLVATFDRRGDRFAVASLLARSGTAELAELLPALDPGDAARLRRRRSR